MTNTNENYDCTADVQKHIRLVRNNIDNFAHLLASRAQHHDESKLELPEKVVFDEFTPKLKELTFGSDEYKAALKGMGAGLQHHYAANSHHPEHYKDGINGMTLVDLVEMVCDWMAASDAKRSPVNLAVCVERFGISPQLLQIINNTLRDEDYWNTINGAQKESDYSPDGPRYARDGATDEALQLTT